MSHKTIIAGTSYDITGGTVLLNGTKFHLWGGGETIIDGTSFQINFSDGLTWVLNKSITNRDFLVGADFTSNGKSFNVLQVTAGKFEPSYIIYDGRVDGMWYAVYNGNWTQEAFRTVTFAEMPTGTLLTWLQANAVQL